MRKRVNHTGRRMISGFIACAIFCVVPLATAQVYDDGSNVRQPASGEYLRPEAYDYAFDPYDSDWDPWGYETAVGSSWRYDRYGDLRAYRTDQRYDRYDGLYGDRYGDRYGDLYDDEDLYGYVYEEEGYVSPFEDRDVEYGYFRDPATGERQYGWHRDEVLPGQRIVAPRDRRRDMRRERDNRVAFSGVVIELTRYTGRTDNQVHLLARLRQDDGSYERVALGPAGGAGGVREGNQISGVGERGILRGRPTILADRIQLDGVYFGIERHDGRKVRSYVGEMVTLSRVRLEELGGVHLMGPMRLDDGQTVRVLLGPLSDVRKTNLQSGNRVEVWATEGWVGAVPTLIAEQIEANDRSVVTDYPRDRYQYELQ